MAFATLYEVGSISLYVTPNVIDVSKKIGATARLIKSAGGWVVITHIVRPTYMFMLRRHCNFLKHLTSIFFVNHFL